MNKSARILLTTMLLLTTLGVCIADNAGDLARENEELRKRVDRLEKDLQELKAIVTQQTKAAPSPTSEQKPEVAPQLSHADFQRILAMVQKQTSVKKPVWSNLDIQLYGYLKLDASYDTSRTSPGNYVKWVDSEISGKDDNEFNMTARQTRLGMRITGPEENGVKTSGRVEIDFYEGGAENKPRIMMRHAYLKIDWPEDQFNIIAGQTSDVISPLNPSTLNYSVMWWAGNIGYRRAQIRLTKTFSLTSDVDLKLEGAIARTIGDDELVTTADAKSGEDAGFPSLQGRASLKFPWLGYKPTTVGFSGHWGKEEYDNTATTATSEEFETWSVNFDLTQPIYKWLTIKGEFFNGENLDAYLGGIGQGVRSTTSAGITTYHDVISSKGGWLAANLGPWQKWRFNLGAGLDDVDNGDVNAAGRTQNRSVFANAIYSINKNTEIGFEISQWHTERKGQSDADNLRAQTSFIYKF